MFPINNNENLKINFYKGPLNRKEVSNILFKTDIFVDASLMEGFGLMALEAMAAGAVPVMSQSFGVDEYAEDSKNCFIIKEVNNAEKYVEKIEELLKDEEKLKEMSKNAQDKALEFDIDKNVKKYIEYFKNVKIQEISLTEKEKEESKRWVVKEEDIYRDEDANKVKISKKRKLYQNVLKVFPKGLKTRVKNFLIKLTQG